MDVVVTASSKSSVDAVVESNLSLYKPMQLGSSHVVPFTRPRAVARSVSSRIALLLVLRAGAHAAEVRIIRSRPASLMDPAAGAHLFEIARAFVERRLDSWRRPPAESASNELRSVGAGVSIRVGERLVLKRMTKLKPIAAHAMPVSIEP